MSITLWASRVCDPNMSLNFNSWAVVQPEESGVAKTKLSIHQGSSWPMSTLSGPPQYAVYSSCL